MKSLPANIASDKDKLGYAPRLYVQLADEGKCYATETATIDGDLHANLIERMSPIEMAVDRLAGLARASQFVFTLLNQGLESDLLSDYPRLENDRVRVLLALRSNETAAANMAELFRGVIDDWEATRREMTVHCIDSGHLSDRTVPPSIIETDTFARAAEAVVGSPLPWLYGDFPVSDNDFRMQEFKTKVAPLVLTDKATPKYVLADHAVKSFSDSEDVFVYFDNIDHLGKISDPATNLDYSAGETYGGATRATLRVKEDLKVELFYWGGGEVDSDLEVGTVVLPELVLDKNLSGNATIGGTDDVLAIRLNGPSRLGGKVDSVTVHAYVTDSSDNGINLSYYDHGAAAPAWSAWRTPVEGAAGAGWKSTVAMTKDDGSWDDWDFSDITIGIKNLGGASAGEHTKVSALCINIVFEAGMEVAKYIIKKELKGNRWTQRYEKEVIFSRTHVPETFGNLYAECDGAADDASGTISAVADALLENPDHILEDILRNRLGMVTEFGDSTSEFNISAGAGYQMIYSWSGTGTDPNFASNGLKVGDKVFINAANFAAVNNGRFEVGAVTDDYFLIVNGPGVPQAGVTIGSGGFIAAADGFDPVTFENAASALSGRKFAFSLRKIRSLLDLLDQFAEESQSRIYWNSADQLVLEVFDSTDGFAVSGTNTPADGDIYTHDPSITDGAYDRHPIVADSFRFGKTPLSEVRNQFHFHYARSQATGQYEKLLFCTESGNNLASPGTLQTQCANSQTNNKVTNRMTMECDFIRDDATAELLLEYYAGRLLNRKYLIRFRTWLNACGLEIGDFINVRHPLIAAVISGYETKKWEVIGLRVMPPSPGDPMSASIEIEAVEV